MQENYRTDFCLKGSVINIINIGKLGMTQKKLTSVPKEYIDKSKRVDAYLEITSRLNPSSMHFFDEACSLVQSKFEYWIES